MRQGFAVAILVVAGCFALAAGSASAASIYQRAGGCNPGPCTDSDLVYAGTNTVGEPNNVLVTQSGGTYRFQELAPGTTITGVYSICTLVSPTEATCPTTMPDGRPLDVDAELHDGADQIDMRTTRPAQIEGGAGSDVLKGGSAADTILGDQDFVSAPGPDGADFIDGRGGADFMQGDGATNDTISYASRSTAVNVSLDNIANDGGFGEGDNARADVEIVRATDAGDTLTGNNDPNHLVGLGGFDVLTGLGGPDTLEGGDTDDHLDGGSGNDTLLGQGGGDTLRGGLDPDSLDGGTEDDHLLGGFGADDMFGGSGTDDVDYTGFDAPLTVIPYDDAANDGMAGEGDNVHSDIERIFGAGGNDRLEVSFDGGEAWGRGGNDTLLGHNPDDRLEGGDGNDTLDGRFGADVMNGGAGTDTVDYTDHWFVFDETGDAFGVSSTPNATADDGNGWIDVSEGGGFHDNVGSDIENVIGSGGPDVLVGTADANTLQGGGMNDSLRGAASDDLLLGGDGDDLLRGDPGNDSLDGGPGADDILGGDDVDIATYASRSLAVLVRIDGIANDGEIAANERDNVRGNVEHVRGGTGADLLVGSSAENTLFGGAGNDTLSGGLGGDTLNGQAGVDTIDYSERTTRVAVTLDERRNDGSDPDLDGLSSLAEEGDLDRDVENVDGGSGDDFLRARTADAVANLLRGFAGDDRLVSRDGTGTVDTLECGPGAGDRFAKDPSDVQADCEIEVP